MLVHFPILLLVDDDPTIIRSLRVNLEADGFDVMAAYSGGEAMTQLQKKLPDLAIVDLLLPDMHGFDLCKKIKSYLDLPIIMLTAVGDEDSVTNGLELYAEDYVVKPFSYRELLARINRVIKRTQRLVPEQIIKLDEDVRLDFARHSAILDSNRPVKLTPIETRILAILARTPNQVVTSERLINEAWPDGEGDLNRLWVNMRRLRGKLEKDPDLPKRLVTERGIGYKLRVKNPDDNKGGQGP